MGNPGPDNQRAGLKSEGRGRRMQLRKVEVTHEIQRGQGAGGLFYREDVRTLLPRLLKEYAGKVQLIYLDPPFQTGHTFSMRVRVGEKEWKSGNGTLNQSAYDDSMSGEKYLEMMQLNDYREYAIHQLSGGMRQRVALARAFTMDSEILLMDEPFSALDKQTSNRLRKELQDIWMQTKKTIFFITHSVEEAVFLGDRIAVMSAAKGSIRNIVDVELDRPRHVYDEKFIEYRHRILDEIQGEDENA